MYGLFFQVGIRRVLYLRRGCSVTWADQVHVVQRWPSPDVACLARPDAFEPAASNAGHHDWLYLPSRKKPLDIVRRKRTARPSNTPRKPCSRHPAARGDAHGLCFAWRRFTAGRGRNNRLATGGRYTPPARPRRCLARHRTLLRREIARQIQPHSA
jgi:hypothetical protein